MLTALVELQPHHSQAVRRRGTPDAHHYIVGQGHDIIHACQSNDGILLNAD